MHAPTNARYLTLAADLDSGAVTIPQALETIRQDLDLVMIRTTGVLTSDISLALHSAVLCLDLVREAAGRHNARQRRASWLSRLLSK